MPLVVGVSTAENAQAPLKEIISLHAIQKVVGRGVITLLRTLEIHVSNTTVLKVTEILLNG